VGSIDGSVVETHGVVNICVHEGELKITFDFHLVNKQVELVYDGIVGRDFLQHTRAKVCYDSNTVTFKTSSEEWTKKILGSEIVHGTMEMRILTLPERSEVAEKLAVGNGTDGQAVIKKIIQGTMEKKKLKLPGRSEIIVKLPVENGIDQWFSNFFRPPPTWPNALVLSAPLNYPILIFKI
jgi:hypothetical protein